MKWAVVTIFPEMVRNALGYGVIGKGISSGKLVLETFDPRDHAVDSHKTVDARPYGGGPGMLMKVETLRASIAEARIRLPNAPVLYLSPQGEPLRQTLAFELAELPELILVCGRYEGIDERVVELDVDREISVGDFVLSGGEPAVIALLDAVGRLVPGILGHAESVTGDSFSHGILANPQYTRPDEIEGLAVPHVLLSGNHSQIARWRRKQALGRTWQRRSDLLGSQVLSEADKELLDEFIRENKQ